MPRPLACSGKTNKDGTNAINPAHLQKFGPHFIQTACPQPLKGSLQLTASAAMVSSLSRAAGVR